MPAALKKMLFVFKPGRGSLLVAKNKGHPPSFFIVMESDVACSKRVSQEFLHEAQFRGICPPES